jgi:hypothetical protein
VLEILWQIGLYLRTWMSLRWLSTSSIKEQMWNKTSVISLVLTEISFWKRMWVFCNSKLLHIWSWGGYGLILSCVKDFYDKLYNRLSVFFRKKIQLRIETLYFSLTTTHQSKDDILLIVEICDLHWKTWSVLFLMTVALCLKMQRQGKIAT